MAWLQSVFVNFWNAITHQDLQGTKYYPGTRQPHLMYKGLCTDTTQTAGQKRVGVVNRDPQDSPKIIHDTFLQAINSARTNIQIISPYFVPCRHITKALRRAQKRGVRVQVMVSEKCDVPITPRVVDHNMKKLMRAGAEVYYFQGGFHHSKIMMVDSTYAFVGSANLNSRSLSFDYECNLLIADPHTTAELSRIFCKDDGALLPADARALEKDSHPQAHRGMVWQSADAVYVALRFAEGQRAFSSRRT